MASKRKSEKQGDVRSSQSQRVLASTSLQHKQEPTKKATGKEKDVSSWLKTFIRIMHEHTS